MQIRVQWPTMLLLALASLGCASFAGRAAGKAAPTVVEGSLQTLNSPESRRVIEELLTSPELQEGARQLAMSLSDGAFAELTSEEQDARLAELTKHLSAAFFSGLMAGASEEQNRARLNQLTHEWSRSFWRGFVEEVRGAVSPEDRDEFAENVRRVLFELSRESSRGIVTGMSDALAQQRRESGLEEHDTLTARMRTMLERGSRLTTWAAVGLIVIVAILAALLVHSMLRHRRERLEWRKEVDAMKTQQPASFAQALQTILRDPELRQRLSDSLRSPESRPPTH